MTNNRLHFIYRAPLLPCLLALGLIGCGGDIGASSSAAVVASSAVAVASLSSESLSSAPLSSAATSSVLSSSALPVSSSAPSSAAVSSSSLAISSLLASSSSAASQALVNTVIQEDQQSFCAFNGLIETEHTGFTGAGYANAANAVGAKLTWAVNVAKAGRYTLKITYANGGTTNRPATFAVDAFSASLNFSSTNAWTTWQSETLMVELSVGSHLLTLSPKEAAGLANIDSLTLTGGATAGAAMCPQQTPITLWLAGDSTVANGLTPCPVGWGKTFGELFNDKVTVQNYAVGGRSVRTWLYDITSTMGNDKECVANTTNGQPVVQDRWITMQAKMQPGDYLFIQFGINDGDTTCPRHVGAATLKNEYRMMAKAAIARGATPVLITPAPALKCSGSTAVASRGFLTEVKALASELNIPLIDLHQLGTNLYNQRAFCPVAGGDVSASTGGAVGQFFCDDHTHFDTPGAREMGRLLINALSAQGSPLANYVRESN